jgi:hypothetical protein
MGKYTNGVVKVVSKELQRRIVEEIESGDIGQSDLITPKACLKISQHLTYQ